mmetsp:Transcript_6627/g.14701  ORF Transcript_6627/g.14701 Transcript_6627/m.14701 type:complete len:267 (-) Transcript_6627:84-884(-)
MQNGDNHPECEPLTIIGPSPTFNGNNRFLRPNRKGQEMPNVFGDDAHALGSGDAVRTRAGFSAMALGHQTRHQRPRVIPRQGLAKADPMAYPGFESAAPFHPLPGPSTVPAGRARKERARFALGNDNVFVVPAIHANRIAKSRGDARKLIAIGRHLPQPVTHVLASLQPEARGVAGNGMQAPDAPQQVVHDVVAHAAQFPGVGFLPSGREGHDADAEAADAEEEGEVVDGVERGPEEDEGFEDRDCGDGDAGHVVCVCSNLYWWMR